MPRLSKESIVGAYNDLVRERGGRVVGGNIFTRETGISRYYWQGGYWRSWVEFQQEAGHKPNQPTKKIADEIVLNRFAELALEQARVPTEANLIGSAEK